MLFRILPVALVLLVLTGCSTPEIEPLTLVQSKSPVQLLRNEAWYRLPEVMVKGDSETTDVSVACDDDPQELMRSWHSSTIALVNNSFAPRVVGVGDQLAQSFVDQGWEAERTETDLSVVTVLTRPVSIAVIEIEAVPKTSEHRATVRISATGPCVPTAGKDSDEVRSLEAE
jgi:hypothetical protein